MTVEQISYFIAGYAGISVVGIVVIVTTTLLLTLAAYKVGITLHRRMLNTLIKLPLR